MALNPVKVYKPLNNGRLKLVDTISSEELDKLFWVSKENKFKISNASLKRKLSRSEYIPQHNIDELL